MQTRLSWYRGRLAAMSPREVAWRTVTAARPKRPKVRAMPNFDQASLRATAEELTEATAQAVTRDCERIAGGELEFWGQPVSVNPAAPDWRRDPLTGELVAAGARGWTSDLKPIWELHRQQHLLALAAGAALTGRKQWAGVCTGQMLDWIEKNPPGSWPGWASAYETAHRLVGWAWSLSLIGDTMTASDRDRIAESYALQADFVARRPSRYSSANNHRLAELTGLLAAALVGAHEIPWERLWRELEERAREQIYPDGGSREQAAGYFLYVLEILWTAATLARAANRELGTLRGRLETMLAWLAAVQDGAGEPPGFGDDAEDRMVRLEYFEPRRAAAISLRVRMVLEGRSCASAGSRQIGQRKSSALKESGLAILRGGDGEEAVRVTVDTGELGFGALAAHGHADALAVLVDLGGRCVLRDSGTFSYAPSDGRDLFRETPAHNTVTVDGASQAEILGPHIWGKRFQVKTEALRLTPDVDYVRASHSGFARQQAQARHARAVTFVKPGAIVVMDRITAARPCTASLAWHLMPDETLENLASGRVALAVTGAPLPRLETQTVQFSRRYRSVEPAPRSTWTATGIEIVFATVIVIGCSGAGIRVGLRHENGFTEVEVEVEPGERLCVREDWVGASSTVVGDAEPAGVG